MPETATILRFPSRSKRDAWSPEEALAAAKEYVEFADTHDASDAESAILKHPESVLATLSILKELSESQPARAREIANRLYIAIQRSSDPVGLFDERDYLLGELARQAGSASRLLGDYETALKWFEQADAAYANTLNPAPLLASVTYARLAIRYETHRYGEILDLVPSLVASFARLGMTSEVQKTKFVEALTLRASGSGDRAFGVYRELCQDLEVSGDRSLFGQVLVHMGDYCSSQGDFENALGYYRRAVPVISAHGRPAAVAELKWSLGATYRAQGHLAAALEAYRAARVDYRELGQNVFESFVGLAIADTLLALERPREAEWEIFSALPAIESAQLGTEVAAAVALLRESARQRKADPEALRDLTRRLAASR